MGDIYNSQSLLAQITNDLKQLFDLSLCQSGRRLVEDDDFRLMRNRFCNLAHLLFSDCQSAHCFLRINVDMHSVEQLLCFFIHLLVINPDSLLEFSSDEDVLGNCKMSQHVQLLLHDNNACVLSFTCIMKFYFFSFICNCSGIFLIDTCQHLHQC